MMTQKHKLIELICECNGDNYYQAERIADYLIENGVAVLPCKVGDTVYVIRKSLCKWRDLDKCISYCDGYENIDGCWQGSMVVQEENFYIEMLGQFGKTVFLTREEAETAIRGN